jgi:hypothetical protein
VLRLLGVGLGSENGGGQLTCLHRGGGLREGRVRGRGLTRWMTTSPGLTSTTRDFVRMSMLVFLKWDAVSALVGDTRE